MKPPKFKQGDLVKTKNFGAKLKVQGYKPNPVQADRSFRPYVVVCRFVADWAEIEVFEDEIEKI